MRNILIVGAGQAGLQLALGLRAEGFDVTLVSARTPADLRAGAPLSTQAMFEPALATERRHGLNLWEARAPRIDGLHVSLSMPHTAPVLDVYGRLDAPARSVDQRVKMAGWLELAEQRGVAVQYRTVSAADLDGLAAGFDLTVVAAGRGDLTGLFAPDTARSPWSAPARALAVSYVHGLEPDPAFGIGHVANHTVAGAGELFVMPALSLDGPCDILFWEAVPGGPLDVIEARDVLGGTLALIKEFLPAVYERAGAVEAAGAKATLAGRFTPTVREPVAVLPGGTPVLGLGDVVLQNDPLTGQGANTAAKAADHYLTAILARDGLFDAAWMTGVFESFWQVDGRAVTDWTNLMLGPPPQHVQQVLGAAARHQVVADRLANGFADPSDFGDWFLTADRAEAYLGTVTG